MKVGYYLMRRLVYEKSIAEIKYNQHLHFNKKAIHIKQYESQLFDVDMPII